MNNMQAECGCCFFEFVIENLVQCEKGHRVCFGCLRRQVEDIIYGSFKAHGCLPCMYTGYECKDSIRLSEMRRALSNDVVERYENCQALEAVAEAKLGNLVYCPFCNIPCEVDKCVQVFDCPNPRCLLASCIQCKEASHLPLSCEENGKTSEPAARTKVEERMTKAVVRQCKTCNAAIVKMDGCNRVTCTRCRTTMCYVCRQAISSNYEHFCEHHYQREPGKPCQICKVEKCSLWETEVEDNVALEAREEALKEFADKEFGDQKIGPPLLKKTVQSSNQDVHVNVYDDDHVNIYWEVQGNEGLGHRAELEEQRRQLVELEEHVQHVRQLVAHPFAITANRAQEHDRAVLEEEEHIPLPVDVLLQIVRADGDDPADELVYADDEVNVYADDHVANMEMQRLRHILVELEEEVQQQRELIAHMTEQLFEEEQHIVRADDEDANMQLQANEDDGTEEQRAEDKGTMKDGDLQSN